MGECIFCKMVEGAIQPEVVYENEAVLAFKDINPQAPVHVLVIPRKHIPSLNDLEPEHTVLVGEMYLAAKQVAQLTGIAEAGYRTVMNCGPQAGQTVFHLHLHVLGGRHLGWPPG